MVSFLPLQGCFNLLIYTSPKWKPYLRTCTNRLHDVWVTIQSFICKGCAATLSCVANAIQKCAVCMANYANKNATSNSTEGLAATTRVSNPAPTSNTDSATSNRNASSNLSFSIRNIITPPLRLNSGGGNNFGNTGGNKATQNADQELDKEGNEIKNDDDIYSDDREDDFDDGDSQNYKSYQQQLKHDSSSEGFSSAFFYLSGEKIKTIEEAKQARRSSMTKKHQKRDKGAEEETQKEHKEKDEKASTAIAAPPPPPSSLPPSHLQPAIKRISVSDTVRPLDSMASSVEVIEFEYNDDDDDDDDDDEEEENNGGHAANDEHDNDDNNSVGSAASKSDTKSASRPTDKGET